MSSKSKIVFCSVSLLWSHFIICLKFSSITEFTKELCELFNLWIINCSSRHGVLNSKYIIISSNEFRNFVNFLNKFNLFNSPIKSCKFRPTYNLFLMECIYIFLISILRHFHISISGKWIQSNFNSILWNLGNLVCSNILDLQSNSSSSSISGTLTALCLLALWTSSTISALIPYSSTVTLVFRVLSSSFTKV